MSYVSLCVISLVRIIGANNVSSESGDFPKDARQRTCVEEKPKAGKLVRRFREL